MGLRAAGRDEHRRRLHLERAPQVGSRRRAAHTAHSARCRLRDTSAMRRLERLPVRWRLAVTSAGPTVVILLLFAIVVGPFAAPPGRSSFDDDPSPTPPPPRRRVAPPPGTASPAHTPPR